MDLSKLLKLITLVFCVSTVTAICQGQTEKFSDSAIRLTFENGQPLFFPLFGSGFSRGMGISSALLTKTPNVPGERPSTFIISAQRFGAEWDVQVLVTLASGVDKPMGGSRLKTGDMLKLDKLSDVGVTPARLSIVRIETIPAAQPEIVNRTSSISLLSIKTDTVPGYYRLTLKSNSSKPVQSIELRNYKGTKLLSYFPPEGVNDRVLIEPGGTFEANVETAAGYEAVAVDAYKPYQSDLIELSSVVFVDGSFEGQLYNASVVVAELIGNNVQLDEVIRVINETLGESDADALTPAHFKQRIMSLKIDVMPEHVRELGLRFPMLKQEEVMNLSRVIGRGLFDVKSCVLSDLHEFERPSTGVDSVSFNAWLLKEKEKCERWRRKKSLAS